MKRSMGTMALAALALAGLVACDPPPPAPQFVVDTFGSNGDLVPGDGICDDGTGACSVQAAFDEANALGRAHITLPAGDHESLYTQVTAHITVEVDQSADPTAFAVVGGITPGVGLDLHIAPGGALVSRSVQYSGGSVIVEGDLVAERFAAVGGTLHVFPTGAAVLRNALVGPVENAGQLRLLASTVYGDPDDPALVTTGTGATAMGATAVLPSGVGPACSGTAPTSLGYNVSADATCALSGPGDVVGDPSGFELHPEPGSSRIDIVPLGEHGCGTNLTVDIRGSVRPRDGDGDGTAACDAGAWERLHWS